MDNLDLELQSSTMRNKRDNLLDTADLRYCNADLWMLMAPEVKIKWREYKQALRDISLQEGFPFNVIWPELPDTVVEDPGLSLEEEIVEIREIVEILTEDIT